MELDRILRVMDRDEHKHADERTPEDDAALEHELMETGEPVILHDVPESDELLATPEEGLERREQPPKRVIIIGAGLAGLVAGLELKRQGHQPLILEAQNRVGGRIYTLRSFAPGLYAEAGGMRIPRA